ncbi:MAG: MFS transporter [Flavobacteriales bacterium]|nr:MAG: MFS transporter [Flavobacteriales bacterium]
MKNKSALYLLIAANAVSGFAQGISMLAIPWYFSDILDASSTFGIIYGAVTFLTLFWGLYVGTLVDRYPRKNIFLFITLSGAIVIGAVATTGYYLGEVPMPLVGLVFCATMFIYNVHYPTLYAFGQEITEKKDYGKINSIIEVQGQATSVLSGAFAAILITGVDQEFLSDLGIKNLNISIEPWSLHEIFLMDAFTYFLAFLLILMIKYSAVVIKIIDTSSIIERLKQGALFLKNTPLIFHFGVGSYAIFAMILVHIHQLMPIYVNDHLQANSAVYAGAEMLFAVGALLSGIGIRWVFKNTNTIKAIIIMMFVSLIVFELTAFTQSSIVLMFVCFILGLTNAGTRVLRITYLFNHIPNHIIGRTGSVFQTLNVLARFGFITLFSLTFFTKESNITWAYFISGLFIFISIFPLLIYYKKLVNLKPDD